MFGTSTMTGLFGSPSLAVLFRDPTMAVPWTPTLIIMFRTPTLVFLCKSPTMTYGSRLRHWLTVHVSDIDLWFTSPTLAIILTSSSLALVVKTSVPTRDPTAEHYRHRCENLITGITLVFLLTSLFFIYFFSCLSLVLAFFLIFCLSLIISYLLSLIFFYVSLETYIS